MRHKEAIRYLPELGMASLDAETECAAASHVGHCPACRDWLLTRELLAEALTPADETADHPDSSVLALIAARPEEVLEPGNEAVRTHLRSCAACRQAVDLTTRARQAARFRFSEDSGEQRRRIPVVRKLAMAAAVAVVLVGAGAILALVVRPFTAAPKPEVPLSLTTVDAPEAPGPAEAGDSFSGQDLEGARVIRSDRALTLSHLTVKKGADVSLEAGDAVVLADGFRVAAGARLRVASRLSEPQDPEAQDGRSQRARASGEG